MQATSNRKLRAARAAYSSRSVRETRGAPIPVLQIEDDPNDRELLQAAVSEAGMPFRLYSAVNAELAKLYLSGSGLYSDRSRFPMPALILLDLKMGRLNGTEMLKWIRAQPALSSIAVVMLSGSASEDDMREAYACGANGFIIKPVGFYALVEMVRGLDCRWFMSSQQALIDGKQLFQA